MPKEPLDQATSYDITMNETGDIRYAKDWLTDYGKSHGGRERLILLFVIAKAVAFIGALPLAYWLGSSHLGITAKGMTMVGFLGSIFLFDVVMLFRYYKARYALLLLGALLGVACAGLFLMGLFIWGLTHL